MNRRPGRKALTPEARIAKWVREGKIVEDDSGCWLWHGSKNSNGYGQVNMSDKAVGGDGSGRFRCLAHRFMYVHHVGEVPPGLELDHLCRVRHCCNPDHLEPVTRSVNIKRAVGVGSQWSSRTACSNGHDYTPENTARAKDGSRVCRACCRDNARRYAARKRGAA